MNYKKIFILLMMAVVFNAENFLFASSWWPWSNKATTQSNHDAELVQLMQDRLASGTAQQATSPEESEWLNYIDTPSDRSEKAVQSYKQQFDQNIEIEPVTFAAEDLDRKGYPTKEAIKKLMVEQYFPARNDEVTVQLVDQGNRNERVYNVAINNIPIFFVKIAKGEEEGLLKLQQGKIGKLGGRIESIERARIQAGYANTKLLHKKNLPIITWVEKIFTYIHPRYGLRSIMIMHAAKGLSVFDILKNNDRDIEAQKKCLYAVGNALGSFQQYFMEYVDSKNPNTWKTVNHGDFQFSNVFFDQKNNQVYFIDNTTMREAGGITLDFFEPVTNLFFLKNSYNDTYEIITSYFSGYI